MEFLLVLSKTHLVACPKVFGNHISILVDRFEALLALVHFDDIAGICGDICSSSTMISLPMFCEGVLMRKGTT